MTWKNAISTNSGGEHYIYGHKQSDLVAGRTFSQSAFLLLTGRLPTDKQSAMFDAILNSCLEHGVEPPTGFVPRTVASVGNPINAAVAAGALAVGDYHGGAIERSAAIIARDEDSARLVSAALAKKEVLFGFGHKVYKDGDPRAQALIAKAGELGVSGKYVERAEAIAAELTRQRGRGTPVNVDGVIAALLLELDIPATLGKAIFVLGRLPGIIAHAHEEITTGKPYHRLDPGDVEYTGPELPGD